MAIRALFAFAALCFVFVASEAQPSVAPCASSAIAAAAAQENSQSVLDLLVSLNNKHDAQGVTIANLTDALASLISLVKSQRDDLASLNNKHDALASLVKSQSDALATHATIVS